MGSWVQNINFTITKDSSVRFYMTPDITITLYNETEGREFIAFSVAGLNNDQFLHTTLTPGNYFLQFIYTGTSEDPCVSFTFESSIIPIDRLLDRASKYQCPNQASYPDINFTNNSSSDQWSVSFDSGSTDYIITRDAGNTDNVRFVKGYNFTVPITNGNDQKTWQVLIEIGYEFSLFGSAGVIIFPNTSIPTSLCGTSEGCTLNAREKLNFKTIRTILGPGDYSLWIFDQYESNNSNVTTCYPFSLSVQINPLPILESFLTCNAAILPVTLNLPGFVDSDVTRKFFTYDEDVLVSPSRNSFTFTIFEKSYVRIWVGEHRLDLDIFLSAQGNNIIASSMAFNGEETIVTILEPGNYSFSVTVFGSYSSQFCETFQLIFSYSQMNASSPISCPSTNSTLQLPDLTSILLENKNYQFDNYTTYNYNMKNFGDQVVFSSEEFIITESFYIRMVVDYSFIYGDIRLVLRRKQSQEQVPQKDYYASHYPSTLLLSETIEPGSYQILILTGQTQYSFNSNLLSQFPSCIQFKFALQLSAYNAKRGTFMDKNSVECWSNLTIPATLNTPGYLGLSNYVHFQQNFFIPKGSVSSDTMYFTVTEPSFFRIYTDPNMADIDMYLYEDLSQVARAIDYYKEESITYFLSPGKQYFIQFHFFRFRGTLSDCDTFTLEVAIEPTSELLNDCQGQQLPPSQLFPVLGNNLPFSLKDTYHFTQTNQSFVYQTALTVPPNQNIMFRAISKFNFVWGQLTLYILSQDNVTLFTGKADQFSANDLGTLRLSEGNYYFKVAQQGLAPNETSHCVLFNLDIMIDSTENINKIDYDNCASPTLSTNLNSISFLSNISGQMFHFHQLVKADLSKGDGVLFQLSERSVLRAFIPSHPTIDIDLLLVKGDPNTGPIIASSTGYEEETIYKELDAGNYYLVFRYLPLPGHSLPLCGFFHVELAVSPTSYLSTVPILTSACNNTTPPSSLLANTQVGSYFQYSASQPLFQLISFSVPEGGAQLYFHLSFDFLTTNMYLSLFNIQTSASVAASIGTNRAFLDLSLPYGEWQISIKSKSSSSSFINCAKVEYSYYLNTTYEPSNCGITYPLPTELFLPTGSSTAFGGPQNRDGSVLIVGNQFAIPNEKQSSYIFFKVVTTSLMRVFIDTNDYNLDIDFYVYNTTNLTEIATNPFGYMVVASLSAYTYESKQIVVPPMNNTSSDNGDYTLELFVFKNKLIKCTSLTFEFGLLPGETVISDLTCPVALPRPEIPNSVVNLYPNSLTLLQNRGYIFTEFVIGNYLHQHPGNEYVFPITIYAHTNFTLSVILGFNFIENDFKVRIRDSNGFMLREGNLRSIEDRSSFVNFQSYLFMELTSSVYTLEIVEKVVDYSFLNVTNTPNLCHKFEFYLLSNNGETKPILESVFPNYANQMSIKNDLTVYIKFSTIIVSPSPSEWYNFTSVNAPFYLTDTNNKTYLPQLSILQDDLQTIYLLFNHTIFQHGQSYTLTILANKFGASNESFSIPDSFTPPVYNTKACACGEHGTCDSNDICICRSPYTGSQCLNCIVGYHSAGVNCIENIPCDNSTCNGNGICDDSLGYPVCTCNEGFATLGNEFCSICAYGYSDYPLCYPNSNSSTPAYCNLRFLPTSFDGPGYLGDNGKLYLQDDFFLDIENFDHKITFSLKEDSVIRIYVEPHEVDIDLWFYQLNNDGTIFKVLHYGIGIGNEETLYQLINATYANQPVKYSIGLRFYYFNPQIPKTSRLCLSAGIQFSIEPLKTVQQNALSAFSSVCNTNTNKLPDAAFQNGIIFTSSNAITYSASNFSVIPTTDKLVGPNIVWNKTFEVSTSSLEVAVVTAILDYRFLVGDLSLVLEYSETGNFSDKICKTTKETCFFGENGYNQNILYAKLETGSYRLVIYESNLQKSQVSPCSVFDFTFSIVFQPKLSDIYNCDDVNILPKSLNSPGFIRSNGNLHFSDEILLTTPALSYFTLYNDSIFRFSSNYGSVIAIIYNSNFNSSTDWEYITSTEAIHNKKTLFQRLPPGNYVIIIVGYASFRSICTSAEVEISITNLNNLVNLPPVSCPISGIDILPQFPDVLPDSFNYTASSLFSFQSLGGVPIWSYSFNLSQSSVLSTSVYSHFSKYDLSLVLSAPQNTEISGTSSYNKNKLFSILDAGHYTLSIYLPFNYTLNQTFTCIPFDFDFQIYINAAQSSDDVKLCVGYGEDLFNSFNSNRFLNVENEVNYQSNTFLAPAIQAYTYRAINISVNYKSAFRVYVAPHTKIDIDLSLYKYDASGLTIVTSSGNGINGEETIAITLEVGIVYQLKVMFWSWNGGSSSPQTSPCTFFDMQFDISPIFTHSQLSICPNQNSHWPNVLPSGLPFSTPFTYSNDHFNETFYFQQQYQVLASKSYNLTLNDFSNVYVTLSYHFSYGDLMIKMNNLDNQTISYGENSYNGNTIRFKKLPKGNYQLIIYEVAQNKDTIGCSFFNFFISIEKDDSLSNEVPALRLPYELDTISYLSFDNSIHLDDKYYLTRFPSFIKFTPAKDSVLRVDTSFQSYLSSDPYLISLKLYDQSYSNLIIETTESFSTNLTASTVYFLALSYYPSNSLNLSNNFYDDLIFHLQLAIEPVVNIQNEIIEYSYPINTCKPSIPTPFAVTPSGYLSYNGIFSFPSSNYTLNKNKEYVVTSFPFSLYSRSVVFVAVENNFILDDLHIKIVDSKNNIITKGIIEYDLNYIDQMFDFGTYYFYIYSLSPLTIPRCVNYQLSVFIRPYVTNGPHVDCSNYNTLPYDLSSTNGGSQPYGGPLTNGEISFFGNKFLLPINNGDSDVITFNLTESSLISVQVSSPQSGIVFSSFLYCLNPFIQIQVVPSLTATTLSSSTFFFSFNATQFSQKNFVFYLFISYSSSYTITGCPTFSLFLNIRRKTHTESSLLCPESYSSVLPNQNPSSINNTGFYQQQATSYFPSNNSPFLNNYNVSFTLKTLSHFQMFLSYNSFSSYLNFSIVNVDTQYSYTSSLTLETERNDQIDSTSFIDRYLLAGNYSVIIHNSQVDFPSLGYDSKRSFCVPFDYHMFIYPFLVNKPFVSSISPPSGYDLSPAQDLTLDLYFSTNLYTRESVLIDYQFPDYLINTIQLTDLSSSPSSFLSASSVSGSFDNLRWTLVFNGSLLNEGKSYQLIMQPNQIFDQYGNEFFFPFQNIYSIIGGKCGNHGNLDPNYKCKCDVGYSGIKACSSCDIGYKNVGKDGVLKCIKDNVVQCTTTTCGCFYEVSDPSTCIPLGTCSDTTGSPVCNCSSAYTGNFCEKCKDSAYQTTYPLCQSSGVCDPACQNGGVCQSSKCKCVGNWDGATCNVCKENYYGNNCQNYQPPIGNVVQLVIFGIVFISLICIGVAVFFLYKRYRRRQRTNVVINEYDDENEGFLGSQFDNNETELSSINTDNISKALEEEEDN